MLFALGGREEALSSQEREMLGGFVNIVRVISTRKITVDTITEIL